MSSARHVFVMIVICVFSPLSSSADEPMEVEATSDHSDVIAEKGALTTLAQLKEYQRQGKRKLWGDSEIPALYQPHGKILFNDDFRKFDNWQYEGVGRLTSPGSNIMQINCIGSRQEAPGAMPLCRLSFPDNICIEYDMRVLTQKGLFITFISAKGRHGEDIITELPPLKKYYADYIGRPELRCYHFSVSRYNDRGVHTGRANWRRNPGTFLMATGPDPCSEKDRWYHVTVIKKGNLLQLGVDGKLAIGFIDPGEIPDAIPKDGKVGFRAIGADVQVQIKNFQVRKLD